MTLTTNKFMQPTSISLDSDIEKIKKVVTDMVAFVQDLSVTDHDSFQTATLLYNQARDWKKLIDESRKRATEPLRKQTTAINDKAKEMTDPLTKVEDFVKLKVNDYQRLLEEQHKKEEEKLKETADIFEAGDVYMPPMETSMRGLGATATVKVEKKFILKDLSQVPLQYLMLDEAKVKLSIKMGLNEIPGLEIYEEKTTKLRAR